MKRSVLAIGVFFGVLTAAALAERPEPHAPPASANATDAATANTDPYLPVPFTPPAPTPTSCPQPFPVNTMPPAATYEFVRPNPVANNCPFFAASRMFGGYDLLTSKWDAAESDTRPQVERELRTELKKDFEGRLAQDEAEAERLAAQVRQLQAKLKMRREKENEIVEFHLQELLRDEQGLGWSQDARALYPGPSFPIEYGTRPVAQFYAEPAASKPMSSTRISCPIIAPAGAYGHQ